MARSRKACISDSGEAGAEESDPIHSTHSPISLPSPYPYLLPPGGLERRHFSRMRPIRCHSRAIKWPSPADWLGLRVSPLSYGILASAPNPGRDKGVLFVRMPRECLYAVTIRFPPGVLSGDTFLVCGHAPLLPMSKSMAKARTRRESCRTPWHFFRV